MKMDAKWLREQKQEAFSERAGTNAAFDYGLQMMPRDVHPAFAAAIMVYHNTLLEALAKAAEKMEAVKEEGGSIFRAMPVVDPDRKRMCVQVDGKHDVMIVRTDEGVVVDIYQLPYTDAELADDPDATCYSFDKEPEDASGEQG